MVMNIMGCVLIYSSSIIALFWPLRFFLTTRDLYPWLQTEDVWRESWKLVVGVCYAALILSIGTIIHSYSYNVLILQVTKFFYQI